MCKNKTTFNEEILIYEERLAPFVVISESFNQISAPSFRRVFETLAVKSSTGNHYATGGDGEWFKLRKYLFVLECERKRDRP